MIELDKSSKSDFIAQNYIVFEIVKYHQSNSARALKMSI